MTDPSAIAGALPFSVRFDPSALGAPRYNLAPTQQQFVVLRDASATDDAPELRLMTWGFVPGWAKDPAVLKQHPINARAETVRTSPMFRAAFRARRCAVIVDGFYEWEKSVGGGKQPWLIRLRRGGPFPLAGLWERHGEGARARDTCTILTTTPNTVMRPIHNRMPVVLAVDAVAQWIDPAFQDLEAAQAMLAPCPDAWLDLRRVSPYVNSPSHDDPRCVAEVPET